MAQMVSKNDLRRAQLQRHKESLIVYIKMKIETNDDWHAVQDAASDIRDIDARLDEINRMEEDKND